jgi:hypothetical protein
VIKVDRYKQRSKAEKAFKKSCDSERREVGHTRDAGAARIRFPDLTGLGERHCVFASHSPITMDADVRLSVLRGTDVLELWYWDDESTPDGERLLRGIVDLAKTSFSPRTRAAPRPRPSIERPRPPRVRGSTDPARQVRLPARSAFSLGGSTALEHRVRTPIQRGRGESAPAAVIT